MPGLIGILTIGDSRCDTKELLARMCQIIKHEDWYKIDTYSDESISMGRISLGVLNPEPQPILNEDKSLCIMMEGEIYNYDDLKKELISKGHRFSINNDPEFILHLYEEYGNNFVHKLNGSFVLAIWHKRNRKLLIANDRYGQRPLYYIQHNNYLLFSSEVKAILEDQAFRKYIDDRAVADFFSFGYILGNKTFFQGVKLLPPASVLSCGNSQFSIKQYWDFHFNENYEKHPESYYVENLSRLIKQAVSRRYEGRGKTGIFLSGGLDSRSIAVSIDEIYYPVDACTFAESPNCDDVKIAKMVADKSGLRHHFYKISPNYLIDYANKAVWLSDGMLNCINSHGISILKQIRNFSKVWMSGEQGNTIFGDDLKRKFLYKRADEKFKISFFMKQNSAFTKNNQKKLFTTDYYNKIRNAAFDSFKGCLEESDANLAPNQQTYFFSKQETRRSSLEAVRLFQSQIECRLPFYDNDLMDFMLSVPPELKINRNLHIKSLKRIAPQCNMIPWQKIGLPLNTRNLLFHIYKTRARGRFYKEIKEIFKINLSPRSYHSYADYNEWFMNHRELKKYIYKILLSKKAKSRNYFNIDTVEGILQKQANGQENNVNLISRLLTFELWNRAFIDGERLSVR